MNTILSHLDFSFHDVKLGNSSPGGDPQLLSDNNSQMDWLQESHLKLHLKYRLLNTFELGDDDSEMKSKSITAPGKERRGLSCF